MIEESLDTEQETGREEKLRFPEAIIVGESLGTKYKTGRKDEETMRPGEEFDDARSMIGEGSNTICEIGRGSVGEKILPDKISEAGCLVIDAKESETIPMSGRKDYQNILHEREIKESIVEDVDKREAKRNTADEVVVAVEAEIASNEVVAEDEVLGEDEVTEVEVLAEDEVLLPDLVTPSMTLIIFNVILPTIDMCLDTALVQKLFLNGFWGSALVVTTGIFTNFFFSSLAWWRLEPAGQKKWSWIFLLLQLWPQLKAFQVHD